MTREVVSPFPSRRELHGTSGLPAPHTGDTPRTTTTLPAAAACPFPSRRSLHHAPDPSASPSSTGTPVPEADAPVRGRGNVGRASMLVALGAMTVAVPLSGFVGPDSSVDLPARSLGAPTGGTSWAEGGDPAIAEADSVGQTVAAASRSRVRAPLEVQKCAAADNASDGTRQVVVATDDLVYPLVPGTYQLASGYGMRISPISGQAMLHSGVDMAAPLGTPIHSVADGVVVEVGSDYRRGVFVRIQHTAPDGSTYFSSYLHQYSQDVLVKVGDHVSVGQRIGAVGSNGWSTGPHLHFEIHDANDQAVEPMGWMQSHGAVYIGDDCS